MIKSAYDLGVWRALLDAGLSKHAVTDDAEMQKAPAQENPAEQLAQIFQQDSQPKVNPTPDNKTKQDPSQVEPHWGKEQHGSTGAEQLGRSVPDFHMPTIGSV